MIAALHGKGDFSVAIKVLRYYAGTQWQGQYNLKFSILGRNPGRYIEAEANWIREDILLGLVIVKAVIGETHSVSTASC